MLAPRVARYFIPASILDKGQTIANGFGEPWKISDDGKKNIIEKRDIELAFEEGRRQFAPKAPSRLSCIWLAEQSNEGRAVIRRMVSDAYIADVRVQICTGIALADSSWFDDYLNSAKAEFIENYWAGIAHPKMPLPEILVDGIVQFTEPEQLEHIRKCGKRLAQQLPAGGN